MTPHHTKMTPQTPKGAFDHEAYLYWVRVWLFVFLGWLVGWLICLWACCLAHPPTHSHGRKAET